MANGQKQARKDNGNIIPIDSKEKRGNGNGKPRPAPLTDKLKDLETQLAALDRMPLSELTDIAIYSVSKELRKKALYLVAREKNIGILVSIKNTTSYADTEDSAKSVIEALQSPKPE